MILLCTSPIWGLFGTWSVLSYFNGEKVYIVSVTGLEDANITEPVDILVPLPQMRGGELFLNITYAGQFDGWTSGSPDDRAWPYAGISINITTGEKP